MKSKISKAVKRIMTNEDMERFKEEMAWQMVLKKQTIILDLGFGQISKFLEYSVAKCLKYGGSSIYKQAMVKSTLKFVTK